MRRVSAPSDEVLVIGAGAGALVRQLVVDGYRAITALDIAADAVGQLRALLADLPGAETVRYIVGDVLEAELPPQVAVWHDRAVFHFITESKQQRRYAARAAQHVAPGGALILATFAPSGPEQCSGLPVARHDATSLAATFDAFELIESFERDHTTPWATVQRFTHAVFRRRSGSTS